MAFLGFLILSAGISVDPVKTSAIHNWPTPKSIFDVRSFHGLAQFYRRFIWNFSSIAAPLTDLFWQTQFAWNPDTDRAFQQLKIALVTAPVLRLRDFNKLFDVAADASGVGISVVLSQDTHPVSYFSEKLSEAKIPYSNYDRELYVVVQSLKFWRHYILHNDFTLYSDHEALRFLHSQKKLSARHARWTKILQEFTFSMRHRPGRDNKVADALSRHQHTLQILQAAIMGFDRLPLIYKDCLYFRDAWQTAQLTNAPPVLHRSGATQPHNECRAEGGFLFFRDRLCILASSTHDFLIWELWWRTTPVATKA